MGKSALGALNRRRNARGEGSKLADEIVDGTLRIIERTGSDDAVTLRSVAKEVGIAAPSIYAHFADRDAILWAVISRTFDELGDRIERARTSVTNPVDQLLVGCEAYVDFGLEEPGRYRVVFAREFPQQSEPPDVVSYRERVAASGVKAASGVAVAAAAPSGVASTTAGVPHPLLDERMPPIGLSAFALLVDGIERCVESGDSRSTDPFTDATAVWVGLHGMVSLWSTMCEFPWPDREGFVRRLVLHLALIDQPEESVSKRPDR